MDDDWFVLPNVEEQSKCCEMIHRNSTIRPTSPVEVTNICLPLWIVAGDLKARSDEMVVVECLSIHEPDSDVTVPTGDGL